MQEQTTIVGPASSNNVGVTYQTVGDGYFEQRTLQRHAGFFTLLILGVGAVIAGNSEEPSQEPVSQAGGFEPVRAVSPVRQPIAAGAAVIGGLLPSTIVGEGLPAIGHLSPFSTRVRKDGMSETH